MYHEVIYHTSGERALTYIDISKHTYTVYEVEQLQR